MTETNIQTKGLKSNFSNTSVWEMIDLTFSQRAHGKLKAMIAEYNAGRPTTTITDSLGRQRTYIKGCIRGNQQILVQELMYFCLQQLEALRRSDNQTDQLLFSAYLSSDRLPIVTNRGELVRKLKANGVRICRNSIYNHLEMLQDAGIILAKRNTSRQRVQSDDGTMIYETCENGRGDFQLFLSKDIFAFTWAYQHIARLGRPEAAVEKSESIPGAAKTAENGAIENQSLSPLESQNLGQVIPISTETEQWENNNRGKVHGKQSGVPAGPLVDVSGRSPQPKELERSSINSARVAAREQPAAALDPQERLQRQRASADRKRELSRLVARLTPDQARPFYVRMLQVLFVSMLYPGLNRAYLQRIQPELLRMLSLYFDLVPATTPAEAFRKLSRAVEMVYRYQQKHEGYKLYDPLSFLRMDYESGFVQVVRKWLPREEYRLQLAADKRSHLLKWQKGQAYADDLFAGVLEALRSGLYQSQAVFAEAKGRLSAYLSRIKAGRRTKDRITAAFEERFQHLYRELIRQAEEQDDLALDPTWQTFVKYLDLMDDERV